MRATPRLLTYVLTSLSFAALAAPLQAQSKTDDRDRIKELSTTVAQGEWLAQRAAIQEMAGKHGAFAVNGLLRHISSQADVESRVRAVYALRRLGNEAVLAMVAGLHSGDAMVRRNLCLALGTMGDERAIPMLSAIAAYDTDPLAREQAMVASAQLGGGGDAIGLLTDLSERFHNGNGAVLGANEDERSRVFFWDGKQIASKDLPEKLYPHAYARIFAEDALRLDPNSGAAQDALVASYRGMHQVIQDGGADDWKDRQTSITDLMALGGSALAVEAEEGGAAPAEMAGAWDMLRSDDKRLRYKAALSLAGPDASSDVVEVLGNALSESAVRQVLVATHDTEELNSMVGMLRGRETYAVGAATGAQALVRAKATPVKDAVILRTSLNDVAVDRIVDILGRDWRTKDVPVILVADEGEVDRVRAMFGDDVVGVVPAPVNMPVLKPALEAAFEKAALNDQRMQAEEFSRQAAEALAGMDAASLDGVRSALTRAIGREDAVQIPAMRALGKIGPGEAQEPAAALFADSSASTEARVAAATALEGILARNQAQPGTITALRTALAGDDAALRSAAARALGAAMSLETSVRSELLLENSVEF